MRSDRAAPVIAHVGFTGSDEDRERSLIVDAWLDRNDKSFFEEFLAARESRSSTEDYYDLNLLPPRDFLQQLATADVVVLHHLWGFPPGAGTTSATKRSPLHDTHRWNRCLAESGARYVFVFGGDFSVQPSGYSCLPEPALDNLIVFSRASLRCREPISSKELTEARLKQLPRFACNETLDLSHASAISHAQLAMVARMPCLQTLLLQGIPIPDDEFAAMFALGCDSLRKLYADNTPIADAGLRALGRCRALSLLSLDDTAVGGALVHLVPLRSLQILSLVNTDVGPSDLDALCQLRNLELLKVAGSKLTRKDVEILARVHPACSIDIIDIAA